MKQTSQFDPTHVDTKVVRLIWTIGVAAALIGGPLITAALVLRSVPLAVVGLVTCLCGVFAPRILGSAATRDASLPSPKGDRKNGLRAGVPLLVAAIVLVPFSPLYNVGLAQAQVASAQAHYSEYTAGTLTPEVLEQQGERAMLDFLGGGGEAGARVVIANQGRLSISVMFSQDSDSLALDAILKKDSEGGLELVEVTERIPSAEDWARRDFEFVAAGMNVDLIPGPMVDDGLFYEAPASVSGMSSCTRACAEFRMDDVFGQGSAVFLGFTGGGVSLTVLLGMMAQFGSAGLLSSALAGLGALSSTGVGLVLAGGLALSIITSILVFLNNSAGGTNIACKGCGTAAYSGWSHDTSMDRCVYAQGSPGNWTWDTSCPQATIGEPEDDDGPVDVVTPPDPMIGITSSIDEPEDPSGVFVGDECESDADCEPCDNMCWSNTCTMNGGLMSCNTGCAGSVCDWSSCSTPADEIDSCDSEPTSLPNPGL